MRTLGILGGMGPLAGAHFYKRVISLTDAESDGAHLSVLLWSDNTIPDRTAHLTGRGDSPLSRLSLGISLLESCGAEVIAIPCNTAHAYLPALKVVAETELLDMPCLAVLRAREEGATRLGVLTTTGTRRAALYEAACLRYGMECIHTEDGEGLDSLIYRQKAGERILREAYTSYCDELFSRGADMVALACTEISVAFSEELPQKTIDALDALARRAVTACGGALKGEVAAGDLRCAFAD